MHKKSAACEHYKKIFLDDDFEVDDIVTDDDDMLDTEDIDTVLEEEGLPPRKLGRSVSKPIVAGHCHMECPAAYCLHKKLKRTTFAREQDRVQFESNIKKRKKQIVQLKHEVGQAQDLVQEYSGLTEQLGNELESLKTEAKHKLKEGSRKYEKVANRCHELSDQLKQTGRALEIARQQHREGSSQLEAEISELRKELHNTQKVAEKYKEVAQVREVELEKEKVREHALHSKSHHLLEHLKMAKKELRKCQVAKKMLADELGGLKVEHEKVKTIAEKLQGKVCHLKADLSADAALRSRARAIAEANNHYREMKPYLGVVFVTEPWPVSSTHGTGTLLQQVKSDSAAKSSGLRKGDVITEVNGKPTRNKTEFYASLYGLKPADPLHLHIIRPSQGPGIVRALDVTMGGQGYTLKQVLAIRRLAERSPKVYDVDFDVDLTLSGLCLENKAPDC